MVTKRLKGDFAIAYRPWRISEIYGQEEIKKVIGNGLDTNTVAHSFLFYGISGTGKTTIGRIIAMGLNCREKGPTSEPCCKCDLCRLTQNLNSFSFREFNSAHFRGIDHVREVVGNLNYASFDGADKTIIVFDECHRLTKDAQNLLLKGVEDSHEYNHFVFCSTEPETIIKTLRNRCMRKCSNCSVMYVNAKVLNLIQVFWMVSLRKPMVCPAMLFSFSKRWLQPGN